MANWEAYRKMKAEAERVGWPEHYKTDLTKHDRLTMSRKDAPEEFIWILRKCGTELIGLGRGYMLDWLLAYRVFHGNMPNAMGRAARWYIYEDGELEPIDPDDAVDRFIESIIGEPVYSRKRNHPRVGKLRDVSERKTAYGKKTVLTIDPSREYGGTTYFSDDVTIGEPA